MDEVKMEVTIRTSTNEEKMRMGTDIHNRLRGNKDYKDNNIILNIDDDCMIRLYIFEECKNVPKITI